MENPRLHNASDKPSQRMGRYDWLIAPTKKSVQFIVCRPRKAGHDIRMGYGEYSLHRTQKQKDPRDSIF